MSENQLSEVKLMPIASIKPYEHSAKIHGRSQIQKIVHSISTYGWDQPIVVDSDMVVIKGHGRLEAAKDMGLKEVPVIINHHLSEEEVQLSRLADNKVAESEWYPDYLWAEISDLKTHGFKEEDLGFDDKQFKRIFKGVTTHAASESLNKEFDDEDYNPKSKNTEPKEPKPVTEINSLTEVISEHKGSDTWLNFLSFVDYLNYHEKIVVEFTGSKESTARLIWILNNCDRSKIVIYCPVVGWGIDWPHTFALVRLMESKFACEINIVGHISPDTDNGFMDTLIQKGFPVATPKCWVANFFKSSRVDKFFGSKGLIGKSSGLSVVQVFDGIPKECYKSFYINTDRGVLKHNGNNYCNPTLNWSETDYLTYIEENEMVLHTAYSMMDYLGCMMCPRLSEVENIALRKRYPKHWCKILEFYAISIRREDVLPAHFLKRIHSISKFKNVADKFKSKYGHLTVTDAEIEEKLDKELNLSFTFDPRKHSNV